MEVHEREVPAALLRDVLIRMQPHQKEIALLLRQLRPTAPTQHDDKVEDTYYQELVHNL